MSKHIHLSALALLAAGVAAPATAQSLAQRIASASSPRVQFSFASRAGVCGNGRSYIQTGPNSYSGSWIGTFDGGHPADPCVAGPVRVVLDRADGAVIAVQTYVGPPVAEQGTADLGTVRAQDAAEYLLGLARQADGRASRDAILPAMLADSVSTQTPLLAIARDQSRPRETRRSALGWLVRGTDALPAVPNDVTGALLQIARDESDNVDVRRAALGSLSRLDHGAGIPPLIDVARANLGGDRTWLSREAFNALARSGDPRARDFLREIVQRGDLPDEVAYTAIRALGTEYATGKDADLLRGLFPKLTGDRSRDAVLGAVAEIGGSENARWLLGVAADQNQAITTRRRALQYASRAGVPIADLVKLYDGTTDPQMKDALVSVYVQSGDRVATDKLIAIAKNEENASIRRRTIAQLSRSDDPRVKELLKELVER